MPPLLLALLLAPPEDLVAQVDAVIEPLVESGTVIGLSVGVLTDGESWTRGYGRLAVDDDQRPDGDTLYEIGSISKVFTALLLADAATRGELSLDDSVSRWLPQGRTINDLDEGDPIRLHHLATHTSGLARMPANFAPKDPYVPYEDYGIDRLLDELEHLWVADTPGAKYGYSNLGAGLLGMIVTRAASADSYEELLLERICGPLALTDTRVTVPDDDHERFAGPHDPDGRAVKRWALAALVGAGGIRSSVNDLLRFGAAQLRPEATELGPAISLTHEVRHPFDAGGGMALGWHVSPVGIHWHNGQTGGYHGFLAVDRERRFVVAALANTANGIVSRATDQIVVTLLGKAPSKIEVRAPIPLPIDILDRYVGRYRMSFGARFTLTREDDRLFAQLTGQPAIRIYPTSRTRFFYRAVDAEITFELDDAGAPVALTLHQNGADMRCTRIVE